MLRRTTVTAKLLIRKKSKTLWKGGGRGSRKEWTEFCGERRGNHGKKETNNISNNNKYL